MLELSTRYEAKEERSMAKTDLKKDLKQVYGQSPKAPSIVDVPPMNFMMIDGMGDPNMVSAFPEALQALNSASFTLKFAIKKARGIDYTVMPTEGLWWTERLEDFSIEDATNWLWTIMIVQPEFVTADEVKEAIAAAKAKKRLPALDLIRFDTYHEGRAAQILHVGAYGLAEKPTIDRLHSFIAEQGATIRGKHHEIYLSDPARTAPENLKTIIRYPVSG
jgi:hypothetical protein